MDGHACARFAEFSVNPRRNTRPRDLAHGRARCWLAVVTSLACLFAAPEGNAQIRAFERLVMPGPVIAGHAQYEKQCDSCHVRFARQSQRQLCLSCHKEIANDLKTKTGYHSRSPDVGTKECSSCHTDHKGRNADIVGLKQVTFDHKLTDFPLLGKHATVACADCHKPGKRFHDVEATCYACHQKDDQHRGNLGQACADCHAETNWKDTHFDHEKTAHYALTGAHATAKCASCHADEHYKDTPDTCIGCHRKDDKHMGLNGPKCQDCHTTADWKQLLFDHFQRTGFALRGGHSGLKCEDCHSGNKFENKLSKECFSCHQKDDKHDGTNGKQCADCHKVTQWKDVTFDHARDGNFALNGAHADLKCQDCHKQPAREVKLPTDCFGCHEADDPHAGQLGKSCESCHGEVDWKRDVRFDHDLTRFPLLGKHREAMCEDCHETPKFHDAKDHCVDCHLDDDVHKRRLGDDCGLCHNPNDWRLWSFDHNAQTHFVLDGAHAGLQCEACHQKAVSATSKMNLSTSCGSCHRRDDVHDGEFGEECERCHTTQSFKALKVLQ